MKTSPHLHLASMLLIVAAFPAAAGRGDGAAWMGVMLGRPEPASDGVPAGVQLMYVVADGPAARAGLRARDRVVAVNGSPVESPADLLAQLKKEAPGNWIPLDVVRGEDELDIRIRLGDRPEDTRNLRKRRGWIGAHAIDLPPALREHFGAPEDAGVMISEVITGSPAEAGGLRIGDVVFDIGGGPVRSLNVFHHRVSTGGVGNLLEIVAARDGVEIVVEALVEDTPEAATGEK
jgi:serine protease Do